MAATTKPKSDYGALIGGNAVFAGVDQGIDFTGKGPVYALGEGTVTRYDPSGSGWPGQGALLVYNVTKGALKGKNVYVAEDFGAAANIATGSPVHTGEILGYASGSGLAPGIETGYADASGHAFGSPTGGPQPEGQAFNYDVRTLSAGGDVAKIAGMFETTPSSLNSKGPVQSGLEHVPGVTQVEAGVQTGKALFTDTASLLKWIGDTKNLARLGEMIAGGVLVILGTVAIIKGGSGSPTTQTKGAVRTVAKAVPATRAAAKVAR